MEKDFKNRKDVVDTNSVETAGETKTVIQAEEREAEGINTYDTVASVEEKKTSIGKFIALGGAVVIAIVLISGLFTGFFITIKNNSEKEKVPQNNEVQVTSIAEKEETTQNDAVPTEETTPMVKETTETTSEETVEENTEEVAETEETAETEESAEMEETENTVSWEEWASQPDNDEVGLVIWSKSKGNQFVTDKKFSYKGATNDEKFAVPYRTAIMKILVNKEEPVLTETESGSYYEINVTEDDNMIMLRVNNPDGSASAYVYHVKK